MPSISNIRSKICIPFLYLFRKAKKRVAGSPVDSCQIPSLSNILSYYLAGKVGVFVEVGAYDGISFSNTYHLAVSGWRGIYCEPVKEYAEQCIKNHLRHPAISVIQVAISDRDYSTLLMDTAGVFSTSNPIAKKYFLEQDFSRHHFNGSKKLAVPTLTLSTLIKKYGLDRIDILVVDVEGHELSVLNGLSIAQNKPSIIIIELQEVQHGQSALSSSYAQARIMLHQNQYICIYADLINTVFVEQGIYEIQNNLAVDA